MPTLPFAMATDKTQTLRIRIPNATLAYLTEEAADKQEPVGTFVRGLLEKRYLASVVAGKTNGSARKSRTARPTLRPIDDDD